MKVEVLRSTVIGGAVAMAGATVEVDDRTGKYLIAIGKARQVVAVAKGKRGGETEVATVDGQEKATGKGQR